MQRFRTLIANMPVNEQAFTSKKETWLKYVPQIPGLAELINDVFGGNTTVEISRYDLFELAKKKSIKKFILSTIIWGYPSGMRGDYFPTMFKAIDHVADCLLIHCNPGVANWQKHWNLVSPIEGLGLSTYTKFLHFMDVSVEGIPALILDLRLIKAFNKGFFHEFSDLKTIRYDNAPGLYPKYLQIMLSTSHKFNVTAANLEMFLFDFLTI